MLSNKISLCIVQISKPIYKFDISLKLPICGACETHGSHGFEVGRGLVLEVIRVLDLPRRPDALVCWVINVFRSPLALERGVGLRWLLPIATSGDLVAFRVRDSW